MLKWRDLPPEVLHHLNPAFVSVLLARSASGYFAEAGRAMPYPLVFVAAPVVLHRDTREQLPRDVRTRMSSWLLQRPEARVGFAERARNVAPFVREGLMFGLASRALRIAPDGGIEAAAGVSTKRELPKRAGAAAEDVNDCLRRATFAGRWLAGAGSASTIFALWGIRP
jgi:hypothetical protein